VMRIGPIEEKTVVATTETEDLPSDCYGAAKKLAEEAVGIVTGPRTHQYGKPLPNHKRTADMFTAYLGVEVTPRDVCMLNILQKVARDAHLPKHDNILDTIGYALNAEMVRFDEVAEDE